MGCSAGRVEAIVEYRDALDALCDAAEFAELPVNIYVYRFIIIVDMTLVLLLQAVVLLLWWWWWYLLLLRGR